MAASPLSKFVYIVTLLATLSSCSAPQKEAAPPDSSSSASPPWTGTATYAPAEVQEYRGQKLTVRSSLRDNSIAGPQYFDPENYRLRISGLVDRPLELSYSEVLAQPAAEKLITLHCVEGWSADLLWTGTLLSGLLDLAGIQDEADTLVFVCLDGYETSMELSHAINNNIILAWATNGLPLGPENGAPFQVAAEAKWGYKWAKWVTEIRVYREPGYKGFWEQRGYSIQGDLWEDFAAPIEAAPPSEFE